MPEALLEAEERRNGTLALALLSLFVGGLSGLVCATFRLLLQRADTLRGGLIALAHGEGSMGFLFVIAGAAAATAVAAGLVRRISPDAGGSGIPEVEAAIRGGKRGRPVRNAIVKFVGGLLAIGSGLALGREGPSVQMGHSIADMVARLFQRDERDCPGSVRRRRRRGACHRLQRAHRRRGVCSGRVGAAVRYAHGERGARRIGRRDCGGTRAPWRGARFYCAELNRSPVLRPCRSILFSAPSPGSWAPHTPAQSWARWR